jgi:YesN/AraC family two-component response regulator
MSKLNLSYSGYVCAPYLHNRDSLELKEIWTSSRNIEKLFFVTGTFSGDSQPYFSTSANHYLLAKFKDNSTVEKELSKHIQEKTSFLFNVHDSLFEREVLGETNFISIYYLEYGDDDDDLQEIAGLLLKREKIEIAGIGNMSTLCSISSKFTFPYSKNMVIIEVASEKSHQSVKKYCDQTQRDVNRKGFTLSNLLSLSILDQLK